LSIRRQCELLGLNRSSWYYEPAGETAENLALMRRLDEQYMATPFYGSRKLAEVLGVNRKRVQRLMRLMGLEAIYPRPRTTLRDREHRIYPYLLRSVEVVRPNQVWSSDITYIPMPRGFMYLTVILDWYSRYVLAWRLSNTLDGRFVLEALEEALGRERPSKLRIPSESSRIPKNSGGSGLIAVLRNAPNSWEFGYAQLRRDKSAQLPGKRGRPQGFQDVKDGKALRLQLLERVASELAGEHRSAEGLMP